VDEHHLSTAALFSKLEVEGLQKLDVPVDRRDVILLGNSLEVNHHFNKMINFSIKNDGSFLEDDQPYAIKNGETRSFQPD